MRREETKAKSEAFQQHAIVMVHLCCHYSIGKAVHFVMAWVKKLRRASLVLAGHAKTLQHAHGMVNHPNMLVAVFAAVASLSQGAKASIP